MIFQYYSGYQFRDALLYLEELGLRDFILPFILIFTIIFAVLEKVKVLKQKKYNMLVALAIALIVVIPHATGQYMMGYDVVQIINDALPGVALWLVIIISFLLLIGIFSPGTISLFTAGKRNWITAAALFIVAYLFGASAGWWSTPTGLPFLSDPRTMGLIIIIAVFWMVISFITGDEENTTDQLTNAEKREKLRMDNALALLRAAENEERGTPPRAGGGNV